MALGEVTIDELKQLLQSGPVRVYHLNCRFSPPKVFVVHGVTEYRSTNLIGWKLIWKLNDTGRAYWPGEDEKLFTNYWAARAYLLRVGYKQEQINGILGNE